MPEIKVSVLNEFGEKLIGIETVPEIKKDKYPTVILVHGFATGKDMESIFGGLLKKLIVAGFLVYRFDFSGCGESDGDYSKTSLTKLKSDLGKMINFVKSQSKVDISRIGLLAQSTGTVAVVALCPEVNCIVLTGSISHYKEVMKNIFGGGYNPNGISVRVKADGTVTKIRSQFWRDVENYNLLELIKKIHCPVLFIHGAKDEKVPVSEMEAYFEAANEPKDKIIIEGANHNFEPNREELYKNAVNWFKKYLTESLKVIIVDENDNIIAYKDRDSLKNEDIWRVSALWLINSKGEILMARRALNKIHNPGKWGPAAAGTVEEGETYDFNIIKEVEEEIGLKNLEFKKSLKIKTSTGKQSYFCQWYLAKIDKPIEEFKIQKSEVAEIKWFSKEELKKKLQENPNEFIYSINQWIGLFL